jgi:hypothetical protein
MNPHAVARIPDKADNTANADEPEFDFIANFNSILFAH